MRKDNKLHIRISTEIAEALKVLAKEENRTVSNLVETLLKEYIKEKTIS